MRLGKTCFKGRSNENNERRREGGTKIVKKETKKAVLDSRILRTNIRHRKTEKTQENTKEFRCLYFIVYNLRK